MAVLMDPFDALSSLQQALDTFRASDWLAAGPSAGGAYPALNIFRKDQDFILVAEVPGVAKPDLEIQVKGNAIRLAGVKSIAYPDKASLHRRERAGGRFDRTVTLPVDIDADHVKAECRDGLLALWLPRAEHDKPKTIPIA